MAIIKGSTVMVFMDDGTSAKSIAYATNHTLTIGTNSSEISTKDNANSIWTQSVVQSLNWSLTTENLYSVDGEGNSFEDLFDAMTSRTPVTVKFGISATPGGAVPTGGWLPGTAIKTGQAVITDLTMNAPVDDNASFTATFTGVGALA